MEAELYKELESEDEEAVKRLTHDANVSDHTNYDVHLDADFYYIIRNDSEEDTGVDCPILSVLSAYLLGDTKDGKKVLEIEAFTHPQIRGVGLFRMCLDSLRDDFRGYVLRFVVKHATTEGSENSDNADTSSSGSMYESENPDQMSDQLSDLADSESSSSGFLAGICEDTHLTLEALGAEHMYDELLMEKTLTHGIQNPDEYMKEYGEVHFTPYNKDTLYLYGLLVYDSYLGKGYGREIMNSVEAFPEGKYKKILLQVSSENKIARRLYETQGYRDIECNSYYDL